MVVVVVVVVVVDVLITKGVVVDCVEAGILISNVIFCVQDAKQSGMHSDEHLMAPVETL